MGFLKNKSKYFTIARQSLYYPWCICIIHIIFTAIFSYSADIGFCCRCRLQVCGLWAQASAKPRISHPMWVPGHWREEMSPNQWARVTTWKVEEDYFGDYNSRNQRGRSGHPPSIHTGVHTHMHLPTWTTPERKVTDAATITLSSFIAEAFVELPFPVLSSGTSLVTTPPTMRLRTGKGPEQHKALVKRSEEAACSSSSVRRVGGVPELTHWNMSRCAKDKIDQDREECCIESITGGDIHQQSKGQTCRDRGPGKVMCVLQAETSSALS